MGASRGGVTRFHANDRIAGNAGFPGNK